MKKQMKKQMNKCGKLSLFLCMLLVVLGISGCAGSGGGDVRSQEAGVQTQSSVMAEESTIEENTATKNSEEREENSEITTSEGQESEENIDVTSEESTEESLKESTEESTEESLEELLEESTEESLEESSEDSAQEVQPDDGVVYGESYNSKDEVALYIHMYQELPPNYITKKEAQKLGWSGGSLEEFAPGKSIGGDKFGNYEGNLPDKKGRKYTECDIDTKGASKRGAKRIVFSNDGLIYYTEDHYETFELLYGEE